MQEKMQENKIEKGKENVFEKLNPKVQKLVKKRFKQPTLPQILSIPPILAGMNTMVISETGTGKTESVILPIFSKLLDKTPKPITALYITPLKALNRDLLDRLIWWANKLGLEIAVRHGDTSPYERKQQMEFPPHMLIVTLETLQPILTGKKIREHLRNVKYVIIDECLPYDTEIILSGGSTKKIGKIVESNLKKGLLSGSPKNKICVKTLDEKTGNIKTSKVSKVHKIPLSKDMVHIRTKYYNLDLSMTSDHPILVIRNKRPEWIKAKELKIDDKILVYNQLNNSTKEKQKKNRTSNHSLILDEKSFEKTYLKLFGKKSKNKRSIVNRKIKLNKIIENLKKRKILPLYTDSECLLILSRIIGHVFGDGWLTITEKTTSIGFSASKEDLETVRKDLAKLGFSLHSTSTRETTSEVHSITNGKHVIKGTTHQTSNGSKTLAALMASLGSPIGKKANTVVKIPNWILNGSREIKKEFLSSFLGAEMSLPSERKYLDFDAPRISIYKKSDIVKNGIKLSSQFKKLLKEFNVKVSDISIKDGNIRKDGSKSKKIVITISNGENNLINLTKNIGITYNQVKERGYNDILTYLLAKKFSRKNKIKLIKKIRELKQSGLSDSEIGKKMGFYEIYGNRHTDYVRRTLNSTVRELREFPEFKRWKKLCFGNCFIDEIKTIKNLKNKIDYVFDLTVEDSHNFIANNIVVHNCHETVESKRGVQLALGLERLKKLCGDFQLIMLSATIGSPDKVAAFFSAGQNVKIVRAETPKQLEIKVISPRPKPSDDKIAKKIFSSKETAARLRTIMDLIKASRSSLTFTNTREFAEILASRIKTIDKKFPAEIHHSSLSKSVRIKTEKRFKAEEIKSIICTSSLQLGVDIGSIDLVIQYMSPRRVSQLIQRVGRSGHGIDRISKGIVIATDEDDCFEAAVIARRALAGEIEPTRFHTKSLDVLAHQLVGMTIEEWKLDLQQTYQSIKKSWPYNALSFEEFMAVCRQLKQLGLVFLDGYIKKKRRGFRYYFTQLSTIPDVKKYRIFNTLEQSFVGVLDEEFVALHGEPGTTFIVKGEPWRIIETEEDRILVEPSNDIEAAVPGWEGELIPVPFDVAQEVGRLRRRIYEMLEQMREKEVIEELMRLYPIGKNVAKKMVRIIKRQKKHDPTMITDDKNILVEDYENVVVLHTCFGSIVNQTLGRFLAALLTARLGSIGLKTDPYRIMIQFQQKNIELIKEILLKTKPEYLRNYLELSLAKSEMFQWKFVHVAKRFGAFTRDVQFGRTRMKSIIEDYANTPLFKETMREIETEKLDIPRATELLQKIQSGELKLFFKSGLSPLGKLGIKHKYAEVIGPERPTREIFELFKHRLMNTKIRLACMNCGQWTQTYVLKDMPEGVKCPKCGAILLAVVHPRQSNILKIIQKHLKKKRLRKEEQELFERAKKTADLYITYKRSAAIMLAGRGIGPYTAKRILRKYHETVEDLLEDVLEAERSFLRTKRYWRI